MDQFNVDVMNISAASSFMFVLEGWKQVEVDAAGESECNSRRWFQAEV